LKRFTLNIWLLYNEQPLYWITKSSQSLGSLVRISHHLFMLVPKFSNWTCLKAQVIFKINTSCHKNFANYQYGISNINQIWLMLLFKVGLKSQLPCMSSVHGMCNPNPFKLVGNLKDGRYFCNFWAYLCTSQH